MKLSDLLAATAGGQSADWEKVVVGWRDLAVTKVLNLATVWTVYQIAIIVVAWLIARWLAGRLEAAVEPRLREIKNQPGLLRIAATILRRVDGLFLAGLLGLAATALLEVTWPSNSYLVRIAAQLSLAWVIVSIVSRIIRNRALGRLAGTTGWIVAALAITGWLPAALGFLDKMAIDAGGTRLSALMAIKGFIMLGALLWGATVLSDFLERRMSDSFQLTPTMQVLSGKLVRWALIIIAILTGLSSVGVDLTAFTVLSGAVGIGIGFGLQKLASNLISGVIILSDRSIKPGDNITLGDTRGTINSLHARYVSVLTLAGAELLVPNERFVTETVVNWSYSNKQMVIEVPFGVDYRSDPVQVRDIAIEVAKSLDRTLKDKEPRCQLRSFGDSAIEMALLFWIDDPERGINNVKSDALFGLWAAFKEHGISIPYPHREVILHQAPVPGDRKARIDEDGVRANGNGHHNRS